MKIQTKKWGSICAGLLLIGLESRCSSGRTMIVAKPYVNAQKIGRVEGTAIGSIFQALMPIYNKYSDSRLVEVRCLCTVLLGFPGN